MNRFLMGGIFLLTAVLLTACGGGELTVTDAWARPADAGQNSAAYFVIDNPTGEPDLLTAVRTASAGMAMMHLSRVDSEGVVSMEHQPSVPVPAGGKVIFEPGGLHVMLMDLPEPLEPGDSINLVLVFEKAGEIQLTVPVREP